MSLKQSYCAGILAVLLSTVSVSARTSVAVMTLKNSSGVSEGEAELLSDRLRIELFNTGEFGVMERGQMREILKEQGFQQSGACSDEGCMVEMGQLLGVQQLIGGSVGRLGSMYLVNIRCINVSTARIEAVVSEDITGSIEQVAKALPRIAVRLAGGPQEVSPEPEAVEETEEAEPEVQQVVQAEPVVAPEPEPSTCDAKVFLEKPSFSAQELGFSLSTEEMDELNDAIAGGLEEAFDECLYNDVEVAPREGLLQLPGCRAIVIRLRLDKYMVKPDTRDQVTGTAAVTLRFYDGTDAAQPFHEISFEKTGARHWGEAVPFENAFEEIAESVEEDDFKPYMKDLRSRIRSM